MPIFIPIPLIGPRRGDKRQREGQQRSKREPHRGQRTDPDRGRTSGLEGEGRGSSVQVDVMRRGGVFSISAIVYLPLLDFAFL